jgi:hypothetical protein
MEDLRHHLRFRKQPASVHHAFVACVATFHSVDYLIHPGIRRRAGSAGGLRCRGDPYSQG